MAHSEKIAGSSNGRTWAFEAQYLGSSPSPAADRFLRSGATIKIIIPSKARDSILNPKITQKLAQFLR